MTEKLKSCPFCGRVAVTYGDGGVGCGAWACPGRVQVHPDAWNFRHDESRGELQQAPLQEIREALEYYSHAEYVDCWVGDGALQYETIHVGERADKAIATLDKLIDEQKGSEG